MAKTFNHEVKTIGFPLRGEWNASTTPAKKVPSHGTNRMGLRYAYDFLQVDRKNKNKDYNASFLRFLLLGLPLRKFYCWGEKIYAPCDGEIVAVVDGISERKHVHWLRESVLALRKSITFNEYKDDYSRIAGNYIIMKCSNGVYMAFVHLQTSSISVSINEKIKKGTYLGNVGHSGNSTSPHLHFQLMDSDDIKNSNGILCQFEEYEKYQNGVWEKVYNQIPTSEESIRFYKR
ncbi:M23 family metallopeptidase [Listeria welshimeri]|uniref:M23 family metallopeptidase n=1 Tax=Listeria welshimeri TaxID=1643 RepID=UPI001623C45D|nr:M23 family metallopeptidase [Listeria welshimeri]MBC1414452.1 M23 family metallopeptidase [Listeria welshimeri]MBC1470173.1 M23 family metallopeptidase [Listeria welshimeri]MBC1614441.1 M23 family metallopeptidase [Listeria welshimeri]MBC1620546.1 M23 family metallopeptidase [Listeria welshimeri]MBC1645571.1 M23 family metallopeptidase [Listeria welshimeri]